MYESMYGLAERVRFELTEPFDSTVFKTAPTPHDPRPPLSTEDSETPRLTAKSVYESVYAGRRKCSNCITVIPADKPSGLCWFCEKTQELAAQLGTRQCLRCQKVKPEDCFARQARKYRVCDDCLWSYPMTDSEKRESHRLSHREWRQRNLRRERAKAREYQRARAA